MRLIDETDLTYPFFGSRQMTNWLRGQGQRVNRKRVRRLMRIMGLEALAPKPRLSAADRAHPVYPYLLRDLAVTRPNQVWATDITHLSLPGGHACLYAVLDWHSRYVLSWEGARALLHLQPCRVFSASIPGRFQRITSGSRFASS